MIAMSRKLGLLAASAALAVTLGGCATIPSQPTWYPVQYFQPPAPPIYTARRGVGNSAAMQAQMPPPAGNDGHSWGRDLAIGGAGAIAGTQLAKRFGGAAAGGGVAGETAGAAEAIEGAEALDGLMTVILEDWWLLL